jgi:hypothetical protein
MGSSIKEHPHSSHRIKSATPPASGCVTAPLRDDRLESFYSPKCNAWPQGQRAAWLAHGVCVCVCVFSCCVVCDACGATAAVPSAYPSSPVHLSAGRRGMYRRNDRVPRRDVRASRCRVFAG